MADQADLAGLPDFVREAAAGADETAPLDDVEPAGEHRAHPVRRAPRRLRAQRGGAHLLVEVAGHRLPRGRSAAMARVGFAAGYLPLPERLRVVEFLRMFGQLYGLADPRIRLR